MLSAKQKEKSGYLMRAVNNALKKIPEQDQGGPPVRRTWAAHMKEHFRQCPGNATGNRMGNSCAKGSGHHFAEDYLEQQEGEGFRGASSTSSTEDAVSGKANCYIGAATDAPCGAQACGKSDTAQGRTSPATGCQLGRPLGDDGSQRPHAMMMYSTPLPLATAAAPDHSAAVVKIGSAVGIAEPGSSGDTVEQGSSEGPGEQGSGVSPWMLAGDAAYLSKGDLSTLQNEHVLRSHIPYLSTCEECQRARGVFPQRRLHESQRPRKEIQADKFWFRGVAMLVLVAVVAVGVGMLGTILWQPDELAQVQVCSLEKVGLTVAQGGVPYLFSHLSVAYNRYHIEEGSALTPEQCCRQKRIPAHPTYIFGALVLCMPPPSVAHLVNGHLCKGAYLGPEVASASHWVRVQLNTGEFRIVRSPKIRMIMPLRYEVGLLRGICRLLPGRDRPPDAPTLEIDTLRALPLPNTNTRGPPKEWIAEHGKTPRCRACKIKGFDSVGQGVAHASVPRKVRKVSQRIIQFRSHHCTRQGD